VKYEFPKHYHSPYSFTHNVPLFNNIKEGIHSQFLYLRLS